MTTRTFGRGCRAAVIATLFGLAGCGGGGSDDSTPVTPAPKPQAIDVGPCLNRFLAGRQVSSIVVPDVLTLNPSEAGGFPNGRRLEDPVVDLTIAALFLDFTTQSPDILAKLPLDPSGNDVPLPGVFPYLGAAQGDAPAPAGGSGFVFRTDPAANYRRIDRMGAPAVATVLIATNKKTAYNDDSPKEDATGLWVPTITEDLTGLTDALKDDFKAKGLKLCATGT